MTSDRAVPATQLAAESRDNHLTLRRVERQPGAPARRPAAGGFTFEEIAAMIASLVALGPTATQRCASALRALVRSIAP